MAGAAGFVSIVAAALLPVRLLDGRTLRISGAASIALMGLVALGVPVPEVAPLVVLLVGFALAFLVAAMRRAPGAAAAAVREQNP